MLWGKFIPVLATGTETGTGEATKAAVAILDNPGSSVADPVAFLWPKIGPANDLCSLLTWCRCAGRDIPSSTFVLAFEIVALEVAIRTLSVNLASVL